MTTNQKTILLAATWCAVTAPAVWAPPSSEISFVLLMRALAPWAVGGALVALQHSRREMLAWAFLLSALIFLGQAAVIYTSQWPGAVDPTDLLLGVPLYVGVLAGLGVAGQGYCKNTSLGPSLPLMLLIWRQSMSATSRVLGQLTLSLFAALAALEFLSGKRLLHRWQTSFLFLLLLLAISLMPSWWEPRLKATGSETPVAVQAIEYLPEQFRLHLDLPDGARHLERFSGHARVEPLAGGKAVWSDSAAWFYSAKAGGNLVELPVHDWRPDGVQRVRLKGEMIIPTYAIAASAPLPLKTTALFVGPDLRCGRTQDEYGLRLFCQSLARFPSIVQYRNATGESRWQVLVEPWDHPVLPVRLESPFHYVSKPLLDAEHEPLEIRVMRETGRYVARFDTVVELVAAPAPASR